MKGLEGNFSLLKKEAACSSQKLITLWNYTASHTSLCNIRLQWRTNYLISKQKGSRDMRQSSFLEALSCKTDLQLTTLKVILTFLSLSFPSLVLNLSLFRLHDHIWMILKLQRVFKWIQTHAYLILQLCFFYGMIAPSGPGPPHYRGFTITLGRTPLDEWSAQSRDLYLTIHNTHKRQISMPPGGIRARGPSNERPQIHALDCTATAVGFYTLSG
jgi:hypothetical protein